MENNTLDNQNETENVLDSCELVLFYGPPCSGKTYHYNQNFSETHTRICPSQMFRENKDLSFHRILTMIIEYLKENKNVVIDDQNRPKRTRNSYLKAIRDQQKENKLGIIKIKAICFHPIGGMIQCLWANEWAFAEHVTKNEKETRFQSPQISDYEEWFNYGGK